jgi:cytochrome P450
VTRANPQHLAFAQGNHFCLGAALARLEAQEGFAAVLDRMPDVALSETPAYRPNPMFRSVESLMVTA